MAEYHIEFGGGLGDIFFQMFFEGAYRALEDLGPDDRATISLITHNPFAEEIFANHPVARLLNVRNLGYWLPSQDSVMRAKHHLPNRSPFPTSRRPVRFYPSASDHAILRDFEGRGVVVFAPGAGSADRNIPPSLLRNLSSRVERSGFTPVFVGRSYDRAGRTEYYPGPDEGISLVDALSVPGVASLLESAAGLVASHSAVNMLGWLLRKPQLLLYPQSVYDRHIAQRDQWAFGADFPECYHARFDEPELELVIERFLHRLEESAPGARSDIHFREVPSFPIPAESQLVEIDEHIPRLTSVKETRLLCWLARQIRGNLVEVGCNKGLTTRDLALSNPDKIVYAVDFFGRREGPDWQAAERPSPDDFCAHARELTNVVVLHGDSARLNYRALLDVGMVFIDGDHTLEGVKADTERALSFLNQRGLGSIIWHDYYTSAPHWVGVKQYVDSLDSRIASVEQTWLAVAQIGPEGVIEVLERSRTASLQPKPPGDRAS